MDHEERLKAALADRYSIEREIGSGRMATVYLAQDLKHDREVAVKVLNPELAETLGTQRFLREIKTAAHLTHPHILPVFDSGEADGFLFYVMPFVEGESLRSRLTKERQLPVEDAVQITREIADALAYAHEKGVIHRDVKPANIMLEEGHAVLADFGVAHAVAEAQEDRITRTGTSLGTPAYMSPEQAAGERELDGRSDQYALGCVLYEMLAGHPPFAGAQVEALVRQHLTEEPPSVTGARPSVPEEVAKVIERALAKSPADRFRTTGEMAAALAFPTAGEPARKKNQNLLRFASGSAVLLLVALGVRLFLLPGGEPTSDPVGTVEGERPTIAVLPFHNLSGQEEDAFFTDGMHFQLITQLTKLGGVSVKGLTSVLVYRDSPRNNRQIGEELDARYIVDGGVQRAGETVRMNIQLTDATSDEQIWAETYDRTLSTEAIFQIQSEIVERVAEAVRAAVTPEEKIRVEAIPTSDLDAFDYYLLGRERWAVKSPESLRQAIVYFSRAIDADSSFAPAYSGRADAYLSLSFYDPNTKGSDVYDEAKAAAIRAIQLDPDLAEGHASLGQVYLHYDLNWESAERHLSRAVALAPGSPTAHFWYGTYFSTIGDFSEAVVEYGKALALDPRSSVQAWVYGEALGIEGRIEESRRWLEQAIHAEPSIPWALRSYAVNLAILEPKDIPKASELLTQFAVLLGYSSPHRLADVVRGIAGARSDKVEAAAVLDDVVAETAFDRADLLMLYSVSAPVDVVFDVLDEAIKMRHFLVAFVPGSEGEYNPEVVEDPRWGPFLERIGFPGAPH